MDFQILTGDHHIAPLTESILRGALQIHLNWLKGDDIRGLDAHGPEVRAGAIEHQSPQRDMGTVNGDLGQNHRFLTHGNFGFGLNDVEWRHDAGFDARLVTFQRLLGDIHRLALPAEVLDCVHQIVIGVTDVADRAINRLL